MTDRERQRLEAELTDLQRKANKRRNEAGFAANVKAMDKRIVAIEAELAAEET